ncbi:MAG TPA: FAD-dependent oxidoreductase [Lentisphaeria bacterium]|nr:FAD-dependent oxidoreductase [Lentisphaeria bacterium]
MGIPVIGSWDVIVVGGGPAGCTAAASAAREGAKTLLIEATGCLGGMGTSGLIPAWCPFSDKQKIVYKGMAEKVFSAAKEGMAHVAKEATEWVPIDAERLKRVYDDLLKDSGAEVLFNTFFCGVDASDDGVVSGIVVANKSGLLAYRAKVYVDCSGDADLAAWAGADFVKGNDNGEMQPVTLCFVLSNVDDYAYRHGPNLHGGNKNSPIYQIVASGKYPRIKDTHLCQNIVGPGTVGFNAGHLWDVDNTDPKTVSKAMMEGRKLAMEFRDSLAEYHPKAFANAHLVATAPLIGTRETRRIIGDYVLTIEDYIARRSFPDEVCRNSYFVDVHTAKKEIKQAKKGTEFFEKRCRHYNPGESHGIPYRCFTPKKLRNVLVAGRSISTDRLVQGSTRVMPVCLAMGEAAGMAASFASKSKSHDVHKVDVKLLRKRLKEEGGYIE